ncbi:hypothetical protein OG21DRAFT_1509014 [Imleria badia]|nr:hypothetical protein OG21DRAFT_1509014 [Imleria badia]
MPPLPRAVSVPDFCCVTITACNTPTCSIPTIAICECALVARSCDPHHLDPRHAVHASCEAATIAFETRPKCSTPIPVRALTSTCDDPTYSQHLGPRRVVPPLCSHCVMVSATPT